MVSRSTPRSRRTREQVQDFRFRLPQADHQTAFGDPAALPAALQDAQRVDKSGGTAVDLRIQRVNRLDVVGQDVQSGVQDGVQELRTAGKIGDKDLDPHLRPLAFQGADNSGEMDAALVGEVVPRHRGDDDIVQVHYAGHLGQFAAFAGIEGTRCAAGDGTEAAIARADIAHDQERGLTAVPALVSIRAAGALADGVQPLFLQLAFQGEIGACRPVGAPSARRVFSGERLRACHRLHDLVFTRYSSVCGCDRYSAPSAVMTTISSTVATP